VRPARLPSDLLDRSAPEASRLLALSYLDQIDAAHGRLGDALDQQALHDFRVGLRRLRSAIRAYKAELAGSIGGKTRRQLRDLARATNDGRDVEVQLLWLAKQPERLGPDDLPGFFWLVGRLDDQKQTTYDRAISGVARQYQKVPGKLRKSLGILRLDLTTGPGQRPRSLREVAGGLVREQVVRVREDLVRIRDAADAEQVHRTRISLKRLRYLIEPVARRNRRAGLLVRRFKEAQDLLGEHHDMHVLSAAVAALRSGGSAGSFAGLDAGLATVARLALETANAAFEKFRSVWGGELANRILLRTEELGRTLEEVAPESLRGREAAVAIQSDNSGGSEDGEGQGSARAGRDGDSGGRLEGGREQRLQEAVQAPHRDGSGAAAHHAP
jgi:CHAD domain-containing protein